MIDNNCQCLLIAGEKSGEDHALSFLPDLKKQFPDLHFFGVGGEDLKSQGMELLYHLRDFGSFGISEVIFQIPFYIKAYNKIVGEVKKRNCKIAILIDFQTFNLKIATRLRKEGVEILYYVAPHAWVWKAYRAKILEKTVHTLFTIIPFEKKWFEERGVSRVKSVPHPLIKSYENELKELKRMPPDNSKDFSKGIKILFLPGSRNFEVKYMLPVYIEALKMLRRNKIVRASIVLSPSILKENFKQFLDDFDDVYPSESLAKALREADMAVATSGTVTLTCALFGLPSVVCYRGSFVNEFIYNYFIRYKGHVSLANIVHGKGLFPELLQKDCNPQRIYSALEGWINNINEYYNLKTMLVKTRDLLGGQLEDVSSYMAEVAKNIYGKN